MLALAAMGWRFADQCVHLPLRRRQCPQASQAGAVQDSRDPGSRIPDPGLRASWRRSAVLRQLSQRPRQSGGRQLRGDHAGEHRPACRRVREGRAQDARTRDAAARRSAAGRRGHRLTGRVPRRVARQGGRQGARVGPGRPAPAQSQGIRERGSRSAGRRIRCRARCCRQTTSPRASTTSRRRCRCRPRSSSSMSSPRAPSP